MTTITQNKPASGRSVIESLRVRNLERTIRRMAALVRLTHSRRTAMSFGEDPDTEVSGWWVLAVGEPLNPDDFEARDAARDELRQAVERAGIHLAEYIWVWDEAETAQLVITTVPTRERAETLADHLRTKGLAIRVSRERF